MAVLAESQITSLISNYLDKKQFQPAGVDLTLREVHELVSNGVIDFDNKKRKVSETRKIEFDEEDKVILQQGVYKVIYNEVVSIPKNCIALGFTRSSLLRSGAIIHCAVWDPGYVGRSESLLTVNNPKGIILYKNARLVQLIFIRLEKEAENEYRGIYKNENLNLKT
ncbi:MAG: deoxyuridine 5'-triphosphate nucleotidohydrolase [Candidatus Micrarchaeota archaeon]|nr:deoxyuridine 5'-triphosphate nucleotidohydrolase [Candidatus Micrarchaeota archaeon]